MFLLSWALLLSCSEPTSSSGTEPTAEGSQAAAGPPADSADDALTDEQRQMIRRLESLGYLAGVEDAPPVTGRPAVTVHDETKTSPGVNFVLSAHDRMAYLMDEDGRTLHTWTYRQTESLHVAGSEEILKHRYFRKAQLLPDGVLLAIVGFPHGHATPEGYRKVTMVELSADSETLWEYSGNAHHDFALRDDGALLVLTNKAWINSSIDPEIPVLEDFVTILDTDRSEIASVSVFEALRNGGFPDVLPRVRSLIADSNSDILHTNSLEIIDDRLANVLPSVKPGNVLISIRELHAIAALDLEKQEAVWWMTGDFESQHHATVLANGNILLFDNLGHRWYSAVREFDPATASEVWAYRGPWWQPMRSKRVGAAYRLPNGNTLVVESSKGRALEVTPEKKTVWEFLNPDRVGEDGERIAQIMDMQRLAPGFPLKWIAKSGNRSGP